MTGKTPALVRMVQRGNRQTPQAYLVLSWCVAPTLGFCRGLTRSRTDGASEGKFEATLSEELPSIQSAHTFPCTHLLLTPATRRRLRATKLRPYHRPHRRWQRAQIRLFHEITVANGGQPPRNPNCRPPSTIVDTVVTRDRSCRVGILSMQHQGIHGTSNPTHYYVLLDEKNFTCVH
jgi:hypothetical protein